MTRSRAGADSDPRYGQVRPDRPHLDLEIDPVQQSPGQPAQIARPLPRRAHAVVDAPASAAHRSPDTRDRHHAVLKRLAKRIEGVRRDSEQLVQPEVLLDRDITSGAGQFPGILSTGTGIMVGEPTGQCLAERETSKSEPLRVQNVLHRSVRSLSVQRRISRGRRRRRYAKWRGQPAESDQPGRDAMADLHGEFSRVPSGLLEANTERLGRHLARAIGRHWSRRVYSRVDHMD